MANLNPTSYRVQGRENNNCFACAIAARIENDHAWYIIDFVIIHFYSHQFKPFHAHK